MKKSKSILPRLAQLEGNLDEELARLALLMSQGKLPLLGGGKHVKKQIIRAKIDAFRAMIKFTEKGCWEWQGDRTTQGYGTVYLGQESLRAHRFSFAIFNRREPRNLVCHECDNTWCVNPDHLFEGTHVDNRVDCVKKKRHYPTKGVGNGRARLTEAEVLFIRDSYPQIPSLKLAHLFQVSRSTVQKILGGETWPHLLPQ